MAQVSVDRYTKGGLLPYRKTGGNYNSAGFNFYPIKNGLAKNLFKGDVVKLSAGTVDLATNGNTVLGVFGGVYYIDSNSEQPVQKSYFPSGTSMGGGQFIEGGYNQPLAKVYDDPHWTFKGKAQPNVSVSSGNIGQIAAVTAEGTGSTRYGQSDAAIDITNQTLSAASGMYRIVNKVLEPGNDFDKNVTVLEVVLINHLY